MLAVPLAAALGSLAWAGAPAPWPLGPSVFHRVAERNRPGVVRVLGVREGCGVILGARGQLLTALALLGADDQVTVVLPEGEPSAATVTRRDSALGVALLQLPPGAYSAVAAGRSSRIKPGDWVVAVGLGERGAIPVAGLFQGQEKPRRRSDRTRLIADTPSLPGTPIFDVQGELVALSLGSAAHHRARAVGIDAIRAWLEEPAR